MKITNIDEEIAFFKYAISELKACNEELSEDNKKAEKDIIKNIISDLENFVKELSEDNTLEDPDLTTHDEHISKNSRIINTFKIVSNGYKINNSAYYFMRKTNIYKINIFKYIYIILHDINTNNIVIYEMESE